MIIDAHHHLWDPEVREYGWLAGDALAPIRRPYRVDDLRTKAKESGVDGTVLVQTVSDIAETVDFLAVADANRDLILGVVGWLDLTAPDVAGTIAALRAEPGGDRLVGIRHQAQDEEDPAWLARPDVLRGLAAIADAGLVYDLLVLRRHRGPPGPLRPRPRGEATYRHRRTRTMGRPVAGTGRAAECRVQAVRPRHRSQLDTVDRR
jgi:L-fuconolactonase